jgi:DNA polymerase-3 subunit epsilon
LSRTWRVRPSSGISPIVSRIHGIWDRDVADAPDIYDVSSDILDWIEGAPIVGHNVRVELDIIRRSLEDWRPPAAYDTLKLARMLVPQAERYGLETLGKFLQLDRKAEEATNAAPHSALYDATLSAMLLRHMLEPLPDGVRAQMLAQANIILPEQAQLL